MPDPIPPPRIRKARLTDAASLCALLNRIIAIGGTTAFETPFSQAAFAEHFIAGPDVLSCHVAEASGRRVGFQMLERYAGLPQGWADIATFVERPQGGIGTLLFEATKAHAHELGLTAINATIRADNKGGLAFYTRLGFEDYHVHRAVPLPDGTPVDRICKRQLIG